jgi:hypothetical protein
MMDSCGDSRFYATFVVLVALGLIAGCNRGPKPISVPEVDPARAAARAMELYDADGNGSLSQAELAKCPGMLGHLSLYDTNADGQVSEQEIEAQIRNLRSSGVGLTGLRVQVRMNGRPLPGAKIKMTPEEFWGDQVKPAYGTTNGRGIARMDIRDEDAASGEEGLVGVHYGTYKIEVTHPSVSIPEKYNTNSTLGYETDLGTPNLNLNLSSR